MTAVGDQVATRAWEFSDEELSKTVFAFAELRLCHRGMMNTVSMEAMWKADHFSARSLTDLAVAFSRLDYISEATFRWLGKWVVAKTSSVQYERPCYLTLNLCEILCPGGRAVGKD